MATQVQRRRGTLAENAAFTGAVGEIVYITDTGQLAVHDGSTAGGFIIPNEIDIVNDHFGYASSTGTDTIALTVLSKFAAYAAGQRFTFKALNSITGTATINVNTKGAKTIKKKTPSGLSIDALEAGDIVAGGIYTVVYDGTDMQLIANDGGGGKVGWELLSEDIGSGVSAVTISGMDDTYAAYVYQIENVDPVSVGVDFIMEFYINGSWRTTAYDRSSFYLGSGDGSITVDNTTNQASVRLLQGVPTANNINGSGQVWLYDAGNTSRYTKVHGEMIHGESGSASRKTYIGCQESANVQACTQVRFKMSVGNIAVTIRTFGILKTP